jgi:phytanoyl-CoA dioxygenase PhyH
MERNCLMPILSPSDHAFFAENGYVVVPNAVPQENLDAVIDAIWWFLGMDPDDPEDWYREPHRTSGMVEIYQHQALWNNRQYPRVYEAFTEIRGTEKLWVTIDRACMKPPQHPDHPEYDHKGFIHWDADVTKWPVPFGVQGVLYLTDTTADQGGFQCIPGGHIGVEEWVQSLPPDVDPRRPDVTGKNVTPIPGKAGDLLIWNNLLPHGNGHNVSNRPRLAQYISMHPTRETNEEYRQERISQWREHRPPGTKVFPGDPRGWEEQHETTAELTPLGRKLLGLDRGDA